MILKGTFTSVWDYGDTEIETSAELDTETGEVTADCVENNEVNTLDEEYFTDTATGKIYDVCTTCHTHILQTVMIPLVHTLVECSSCTDPDCDNYN